MISSDNSTNDIDNNNNINLKKIPLSEFRSNLCEVYGNKCMNCGEEAFLDKLILHRKVDNPIKLDDMVLLCRDCHRIAHMYVNGNEIKNSLHLLESAAKNILTAIYGDDVNDNKMDIYNHLIDTPKRFSRAYLEICGIGKNVDIEIEEVIELFTSTGDELITANTHSFTLCPHHLLPVELDVKIGVVPGKYIIGTSKYQRIVDILATKPVTQEEFTNVLADTLMHWIQPQGVMVLVNGAHDCMRMRGIKKLGAGINTSAIRGVFEEHSLRDEFLSICL